MATFLQASAPMEVRLLKSEGERQTFERKMTEARATRGGGFREKKRSRMGEIHMKYADLYGVFCVGAGEPDQILAGFAMHPLDVFSQSYPLPNLTHLPPDQVFECSDLWSLSKGAGLIARRGCAILLGLFAARAILVYPIVKPWDLTGPYSHFEALDDPIRWPYAETMNGEPVFVQAKVLQGDALRETVVGAFKAGFESTERNRRVIFHNPFEGLVRAEQPSAGEAQGDRASG
jgi:hypothetical protein